MSILPTQEEARFVANTRILLLGSTLVFLAHLLFLGGLSGELDANLYAWFKRDSLSYLNLAIHFAIELSSPLFILIVMVIVERKYKQWNSSGILSGYIIALIIFAVITNIGPFSKPDPGPIISRLDYSDENITQIELRKQNSFSDFTNSGSTLIKKITELNTIQAVKDFTKDKEKGWQAGCPIDCYKDAIRLRFYSSEGFAGQFYVKNNHISFETSGLITGTPITYSKSLTQAELAQFMKLLGV